MKGFEDSGQTGRVLDIGVRLGPVPQGQAKKVSGF